MRFWLAVLILFGGFALAVLWQTRWTSRLRSERDRAWAESALAEAGGAADLPLALSDPAPRRPEGPWARVVVGRPSGAEPVDPPPVPTASIAPGSAAAGAAQGPVGEPFEPDFTTIVRPGQSLSVICQQHYGSGRVELVRAVADYNGLDDPDRIRVGSKLQLPAEQHLLSERWR